LAVHLKSTLYAGASALLTAGAAAGTEMCVKCTGPDASYACVVNTSATGTIDTVMKLYCITALAKAGPHASCAIDRNTTAPCQGERKELPMPAAIDQTVDELQQPGAATPVHDAPATGSPGTSPPVSPAMPNAAEVGAQPPTEAAKEAPPKTVQEIVEKSTKSAGDGIAETQKSAGEAAKSASTALEKAGTAVGDAAKNSWKCLSSFFSNC
jgi:hypothetical protein